MYWPKTLRAVHRAARAQPAVQLMAPHCTGPDRGAQTRRASKSAQNQLSKCMSLEFARRRHKVCVVMLHPGTCDTDLSVPFQKARPRVETTDSVLWCWSCGAHARLLLDRALSCDQVPLHAHVC